MRANDGVISCLAISSGTNSQFIKSKKIGSGNNRVVIG
jgi:hypothetical protein